MKIHNLNTLSYLSFKYNFDNSLIYVLEDYEKGTNLFLSYFFNKDFFNLAKMIDDGIDISNFTISAPLSNANQSTKNTFSPETTNIFPPLVSENLSTTSLNFLIYLGYQHKGLGNPGGSTQYLNKYLGPLLLIFKERNILNKVLSQVDSCKKNAWDYIFNFQNCSLFDFFAEHNMLEASFFDSLSLDKLTEYLQLSINNGFSQAVSSEEISSNHIKILETLIDERQMKKDLGNNLLPENSVKQIIKF